MKGTKDRGSGRGSGFHATRRNGLALGIALAFLAGLGSAVHAQQCTKMNGGPGALFRVRPFAVGCVNNPPNPQGVGPCNCVVSVFTTTRLVRPDALFQECRGHYSDGNCRQLAGGSGITECEDGNHTPPFGNWGVRVRGATVTNFTLLGAQVIEPSDVRDCNQWPGTRAARCGVPPLQVNCRQWHSCSCDDKKSVPGHFGQAAPEFVPLRDTVSDTGTAHLAGFFKIRSTEPTCRPALEGKEVAVRFNLDLFELDFNKSDRVAVLEINDRVPMSCFGGRCEGSKPLSLNSDPVLATGFLRVICSGVVRPGPPPGDGGGGGGCTPGGRCQACCRGTCGQGLLCQADNQCHGTIQTSEGLIIETCADSGLR